MNKVQGIYYLLNKAYGTQGWWPIVSNNTLLCEYHTNPPKNESEQFEIAVGAILTQNTAWRNVEKVLGELKRTGNLSKERIRCIPKGKLSGLIRSAGYYNQKAKKLKLLAVFNKPVTRENLLDIWGIGPETADSILLYAYNKPVFVVDAYTKRIFSRVGLVNDNASYDDVQKIFHDNLSKDYEIFSEYHALLVEHAKRHCKTRPECDGCLINAHCRKFKNQKPQF